MSLINAHRSRFKGVQAIPGIYDPVNLIYTLRKVFGWNKAVMKLRRPSDDDARFVFFNGDVIDLNSKVSYNNDADSATTLGSWIGSEDAFVAELMGMNIDGLITTSRTLAQTVYGNQPKFIEAGTILLDAGEPTIYFDGIDDYLQTDARVSLDSGNNFTTWAVSSLEDLADIGAIYTTTSNASETDRITMFNDSRTAKVIQVLFASGVNYRCDYDVQQNTTDLKLLTSEVLGDALLPNKTHRCWFNGSLQSDSEIWLNSYLNTKFVVGRQLGGSTYFKGNISELGIIGDVETAENATKLPILQTDIKNYYSI